MTKIKYENLLGGYFLLRPCILLTLIYIVGISAILRADYNYIDDMGRATYGYKGWEDFSRYLSVILSTFIHADTYLTDVSPLPQMIAMAIMALAGIIVLFVISGKKTYTAGEFIALVPLALSPYFLECASYKFDSPYMALSVLVSVFPLLLYHCNGFCYLCAVVVGSLAMCTSYQSSSGIFPLAVVLLCFREWNQGKPVKQVAKRAAISILGYMLGLFIFKLAILHPQDAYSTTEMLALNEWRLVLRHYHSYFSDIYNDFKREWLILILFMAVSFAFVSVRDSSRKKIIALLMAVATFAVMLFLSYGIYPFMQAPASTPRGMYGFGFLIVCMGICIMSARGIYFSKLATFLLSWGFFVFAFTYGNALEAQEKYTDFRIEMVIQDLKGVNALLDNDGVVVRISGSSGRARSLENMPQDYQILNRLVPQTFSEYGYWAQYKFYQYYGLKDVYWDVDGQIEVDESKLPIICDTIYHTIKGNDDYILIELK